MIGRLLTLALLPLWVWVVLGVTTGLFAIIVLIVLVGGGGVTSAIASDLQYQCDSVVGPDPSLTVTPSRASAAARSTSRSTPSAGVTTAPTTNPYADLTIAPDDTSASDWQRACATALKDAPLQDPPLLTGSSGIGAACAREIALAQVASTASGTQSGAEGYGGAADFTRSVIYRASVAQSTGRCELVPVPAAQPPVEAAPRPSGSPRQPCGRLDGSGASVVVLPNSIRAQAPCGQRVDPSAVSPGDLIFWNYRNSAPTRVGIAVSATELVTADPATGGLTKSVVPDTSDVRVKRVLGGGM
ncbi:hypothetical protein ACRS6B_00185 [Nocardia asteroides]